MTENEKAIMALEEAIKHIKSGKQYFYIVSVSKIENLYSSIGEQRFNDEIRLQITYTKESE